MEHPLMKDDRGTVAMADRRLTISKKGPRPPIALALIDYGPERQLPKILLTISAHRSDGCHDRNPVKEKRNEHNISDSEKHTGNNVTSNARLLMEEIVRRNATEEECREAFTRALEKLPPPDPKEPEPRVDTLLAFLGKVESIWP